MQNKFGNDILKFDNVFLKDNHEEIQNYENA